MPNSAARTWTAGAGLAYINDGGSIGVYLLGDWPSRLGIALFASLAYVLVWEGYLAATDYAFMDQYIAATLEARRAEGMAPAAYAQLEAQMRQMAEAYQSPLFRLPMTFVEIFPVGLLVSIVSAILLRNSRFLPARARA